jgi:hypothetical protein
MKKVTAICFKEKGKPFRVQAADIYKKQLDELPPGKYKQTTEKYYAKASPSQFGWLYGLIYPQSMIALNDAGYEFTNVDQVDLFWKSMFANKEVLVRETGQIMTIPLSKSEFLTIDHMTYSESIRQYCNEYLSYTIEDPDPNWKQRKEEIQKQLNK